MQPYPNYSQMNNPYAQMNNPYADRMNFLQNYQQSLQQPVAGTQMSLANQMSALGKMVDSIDVVKATDIPMDGNAYYFPKADGTEVYCKQWLQNGTTRILTFKPIENEQTNILPQSEIKCENEPLENVTKALMDRFDTLENRIDEFLSKSATKITSTKSKKESAE